MTNLEDIPQDVWNAAFATYIARCDSVSRLAADFEEDEVIELVARAILAERERCAHISESFIDSTDYDVEPEAAVAENVAARMIAAAIRKGSA